MSHSAKDKPSLATLTEEAAHDYLALDLEVLLDLYGAETVLRHLGRALRARDPILPPALKDRRLVDALVLLAGEEPATFGRIKPPPA